MGAPPSTEDDERTVESARPIASVVIPSHGGAHRLPRVLDALAVQDLTDAWEVVLVLDGVIDHSPALAEQYRGRLPLRLLRHDVAEGVASALTTGFNAARGRYLIRVDDDLDPPSHFVADHLRAHAGRADRVVLALTRDVFPETPYAQAYGRPANAAALAAAYAQRPDARWQHLAASFSLHRDAWRRSGGFDQNFAYGEDGEFGYRLFRLGLTFVIDPRLEVAHTGPATSAAVRVPRAFVSGASRRAFSRAHPEAVRPTALASGAKAAVWTGLVAALASVVRSPAAFRRVGVVVDLALPRLPSGLGRRLTALAVEAAARSGERHGREDLHVYRQQKDAELAAERGGPTGPAATRPSGHDQSKG